LSFSVY